MKRCSQCGDEKDESEFYKKASCRDGLHSHCTACVKGNVQKWRRQNPEKASAGYRKNEINWRKNNPDKHAAMSRKRDSRDSANLGDRFVRKHLHKLGFATITPELIELYRVKLLLHRQIKEMSK